MAIRFSEYLITPRDLLVWARGLSRRDLIGGSVALVCGLAVGLWLQDVGAGLFASGMAAAIWWRVDSRWAFGSAIVLLVLIPLMQFAYNANWLFTGASIASGLAVAVWYLLAVGVVRQIIDLRRYPEVEPALETGTTAIPEPTRSKPTLIDRNVQRAPARPGKPTLVPEWRRRLRELEREAGEPATKPTMDGVKSRRR